MSSDFPPRHLPRNSLRASLQHPMTAFLCSPPSHLHTALIPTVPSVTKRPLNFRDRWAKSTLPITSASHPSAKKSIRVAAPKRPVSRTRKRNRLQYRASPNARQISTVSVGEQFLGTVCDVGPAESAWVDINVATSTGRSVRARLRLPKLNGEIVRNEKPGNIITVHVRKVDAAAGRIEVRKGSRPQPKPTFDPSVHRLLESVQVLERLEGKVLALGPYGAVLDVGVYRLARKGQYALLPALLPRQRFPTGWGSSTDLVRRLNNTRVLEVGDEIPVWVRITSPKNARLFVDAQPVEVASIEEEKREKKRKSRQAYRRKPIESVEVGQRLRGVVREKALFGLFISIGLVKDALLHASKMGTFSSSWQESLPIGTKLIVEICEKDAQGVRVRLLYVLQIELEQARKKVSMPTATTDDVEHLKYLETQERAFRRQGVPKESPSYPSVENAESSSDHSSLSVGDEPTDKVVETRKGKATFERQRGNKKNAYYDDGEDEDEDDDDGNEEDDDDDDVDDEINFSDEYLESKYVF